MTDDHKTDTSHQAPEIPHLFGEPMEYDPEVGHWHKDFGVNVMVCAKPGFDGQGWNFSIQYVETAFSGPDLREAEEEIEKELRSMRIDLISIIGTEMERKTYVKHSRRAYLELAALQRASDALSDLVKSRKSEEW